MTKKPRNPQQAQGAHAFVSPNSGVAYTKDHDGHQVMRKGKTARDRARKGGRR